MPKASRSPWLRRGNPFWVNVGCHEMLRALCGDGSVEPKVASIGPLPRLWIHRPHSVREHLCFIPFCVMGAKSLPWMSGGVVGGQNLDGVERGYLIWRAICGKADSKAQSACWNQKTGNWKTENFGNREPFGELIQKKTLQMRWGLSAKLQRQRLSMARVWKARPTALPWLQKLQMAKLAFWSSTLQYIHRRNKVLRSGSKRLIRSFITTPVHHGPVRSTFPSNPSVCPILRVRPGLPDSGAGGTKPSVNRRGGTPRHVMTIRAMDFYCSSSRKGDSPPNTSWILFHPPVSKWDMLLYSQVFLLLFLEGGYSHDTPHCHTRQFQRYCLFFSHEYLFLLFFTLRVNSSLSHLLLLPHRLLQTIFPLLFFEQQIWWSAERRRYHQSSLVQPGK